MAEPPRRRNIRIVLRYDGSAYFGWQRQPDMPTVQARVEQAVESVTGAATDVHASGRTDAGVHALAQVANFHTDTRLAPPDLQRALNANLPADIAVCQAEDVAEEFHARFSARRKTYFYQLHVGRLRDPFRVRHSLALPTTPDLDRMRQAARQLIGRHDFRSFATAGHLKEDTVRELHALRVVRVRGGLRVFATANGFLQHMVRTLVGGLVRVGSGRDEPERMAEILRACDRKEAPPALPAHGLFLWRVDY